ncbi:MAG TPA: hypothetical protein VIK86_03530 [Candidatus Paceibacterota bacterium]
MFNSCTKQMPVNTLLSSSTSSLSENQSFPFTIPNWLIFGMKEGDIRSHYSKEPYSFKTTIYYDSANYNGNMEYTPYYGMSDDNKLILLQYVIEYYTGTTDKNKTYISTYNSIKTEISKIYGNPQSSTDKWVNDKYKNDSLMENTAISTGDYTIQSLWEKNGLYISLTLNKNFTINYTKDKTEWH